MSWGQFIRHSSAKLGATPADGLVRNFDFLWWQRSPRRVSNNNSTTFYNNFLKIYVSVIYRYIYLLPACPWQWNWISYIINITSVYMCVYVTNLYPSSSFLCRYVLVKFRWAILYMYISIIYRWVGINILYCGNGAYIFDTFSAIWHFWHSEMISGFEIFLKECVEKCISKVFKYKQILIYILIYI